MENRLLTGTAVVHILFILFGFWILWMAYGLPGGGDMMPNLAAYGIIAFSVIEVARNVRATRRAGVPVRAVPRVSNEFKRAVMIFTISVGYFVGMFWIGYFVTTFLYVFIASRALGVRSWKAIAITAFVLVPCLYLFFITFLGAHLPKGFLI